MHSDIALSTPHRALNISGLAAHPDPSLPHEYKEPERIIRQMGPTARHLKKLMPADEKVQRVVQDSRTAIQNILQGRDKRLLLIVGECSVTDPAATRAYAEKLSALSRKVEQNIKIVMRVYLEKPRTGPEWTGFVNDPKLDGTREMFVGIKQGRQLMLDVNSLGLGVATEVLNPNHVPCFEDLVSWSCIGARTVGSQTHRELANAVRTPVGMKNGMDGSILDAINGIKVANKGCSQLEDLNSEVSQLVDIAGNMNAHLVMRGGIKPNFNADAIASASRMLQEHKVLPKIIVDCSHGNSRKKCKNQPYVFLNALNQKIEGQDSIVGMMLESSLRRGAQKLHTLSEQRIFGMSKTDQCIDFRTTEILVTMANHRIEHAIATPRRRTGYRSLM